MTIKNILVILLLPLLLANVHLIMVQVVAVKRDILTLYFSFLASLSNPRTAKFMGTFCMPWNGQRGQ